MRLGGALSRLVEVVVCMGTPLFSFFFFFFFLAIFAKGNNLINFLFAFLNKETLSRRSLLAKERGANSFFSELTPIEREPIMKMVELLPLKVQNNYLELEFCGY